jgi:glycosyltransferase involved in cell wall biosynthesis
MKTLDLTVVIPHHNRPTLLLRLLHTIPPHVSVIVVDDGSDDVDLIESCCASFDNVLFIPLNHAQGAGVARQIGLTHVKTTYVMFADSDDVFLSDAFDIIEKACDEKVEVLVFKPTSMDLDGQIAKRHLIHHALFEDVQTQGLSSFEALFKFKEVWSKVYQTKAIQNFKFSKTFVGNDLLFSAQVAIHCHAHASWINECVYAISDHEDAISYEHTKERYKHRLQANADYYDYCFTHLPKSTFHQLIDGNGVLVLWPLIKFKDISLTLQAYQLYSKYGIKINYKTLFKRVVKAQHHSS